MTKPKNQLQSESMLLLTAELCCTITENRRFLCDTYEYERSFKFVWLKNLAFANFWAMVS